MTQQKQKLPSKAIQPPANPAAQARVAAAFNPQDRAVSMMQEKQRIEEIKHLTLEKAQKDMDMTLRILRIWMESANP